MTQAYFSQIKSTIIKYIDTSVSEICLAVAWFTHRDLFQAVLSALDRNVRVSVILIDDIINCGPNGLDFSFFINKGGSIRFMDTRKLLMHNKFCLFDKSLLVTGSYNWTYSAELRNAENIIATTEDNVCNAFHEHFDKLWNSLAPVEQFSHMNYNDIDSETLLKSLDDMREEYNSMEQAHILKPYSVSDVDDLKKNLSITQLNTIITNTKRSNPVLKAGISLEVLDNKIKPIIKKGQCLPYTNTIDARTSIDYQEAVDCIIRYGDSSEASKNEELVKLRLEKLPQRRAGDVTFLIKVTIDTNGYMHIEFLCVNTGISKSAVYNAENKIDYQEL